MPQAAAETTLWKPNPGPQTQALKSGALEVLFGGSAGGGKSDLLAVNPLRHHQHPQFQACLFRRTFKELEDLIERCAELYLPFGATYNEQKHRFRFPSGARVRMSHLQHEKDVEQHKSNAYQLIEFDELTSFELFQYRYMFSRLRSAHGIPKRMRSGTNPEPNWVRDRFAPWVDDREEYDGPKAESGQVLYFTTDQDGNDVWVPKGTQHALSRCFIRADLEDNPVLLRNDPDYVARLMALDPVQRARLLEGNWSVEYAAGLMFQRAWFRSCEAVPQHAIRVRFWDTAGTEEKFESKRSFEPQATNDPDYTVGLLLVWPGPGMPFYVEDVIRERLRPGGVFRLIEQTAKLDAQTYPHVTVGIEQTPGPDGIKTVEDVMHMLRGMHVVPFRPSTNKIQRALAPSAQSEAGNVFVKRAPWNAAFFAELDAFPKGKHKDQVDAFSGALRVMVDSFPQEFIDQFFGFMGSRFDNLPAVR